MGLSATAKKLIFELSGENIKLGELKKLGKEIKKDQDLAMALWSTGDLNPRLLSILINVARNCTPSYLPEFIRIEVAKRE